MRAQFVPNIFMSLGCENRRASTVPAGMGFCAAGATTMPFELARVRDRPTARDLVPPCRSLRSRAAGLEGSGRRQAPRADFTPCHGLRHRLNVPHRVARDGPSSFALLPASRPATSGPRRRRIVYSARLPSLQRRIEELSITRPCGTIARAGGAARSTLQPRPVA
jgi:hypothetical protein